MNTQDSDEDALFRQEMRYPERGAGGFSGLRRAGAGESEGLSACATAGHVGIPDSVQGEL
jgi:hypothetical protein